MIGARGWCLLLSLLFFSFAGIETRASEPLEKHSFPGAGGQSLPYRLARPLETAAKPAPGFPLVIVLHGAGERGTDNEAHVRTLVPVFLTAENRENFPAFIVAPQCPPDVKWTGVNWQQNPHAPQTAEPTRAAQLVLALVARLLADLPIDPARVYLTGLSMGGSGAWDLATRRPELFAAVVPLCGGADEATGHRLARVSVWCFQGAKDDVVRPSLSRNMIAEIKKAGGKPRYTEFPDAGHNIGDLVFRDPAIVTWMFAQRRSTRP